ncbi:MAG: COG1361 S-layer family protein [Candidatus Nanohaloarchaea archaeon]
MKTKTLTAFALAALFVTGAAAQQRPATKLEPVLVQTDPVPAQSGEDAEIIFKVRNTGNTEARNVKVSIQDSYPFRLKPGRKRTYQLGTVTPGEEYYITTEVLVAEDAPDGQNPLKVNISTGSDVTFTHDIPVTVQSSDVELNLANLKTTPSTLRPDTEDNRMTVEVVNNGDKTAENVVLDLELPPSFEKTSSFSTRQALGNVKPGEVKPATFNFDISENASAGMVDVPATLSYSLDDSASEIEQQESFQLHVSGKPQFEVVDTQARLKAGSSGEARVTVRNTGDVKSTATRIRVLDSSDQPFSYGSSSHYIGTLEPGATGTAVFDVTTGAAAEPKQYLVDFEVRGVKDTEVFTESKTVDFRVENGERSGISLPLLAGVFAALLLLAYFFRGRVYAIVRG